MVKVNPLQARRFSEAIGQRAKTDAVDAAMLARFGARDVLQIRPIFSQMLSSMKEPLVARRGLVKGRVAVANRITLTERLCSSAWPIKFAPNRASGRRGRCGPTRPVPGRSRAEGTLDILVSIPAIGEATALTMLIELGTMDNKGGPRSPAWLRLTRDSGQHSGKYFIRAERAHLRQALYTPALFASRFNAAGSQILGHARGR